MRDFVVASRVVGSASRPEDPRRPRSEDPCATGFQHTRVRDDYNTGPGSRPGQRGTIISFLLSLTCLSFSCINLLELVHPWCCLKLAGKELIQWKMPFRRIGCILDML